MFGLVDTAWSSGQGIRLEIGGCPWFESSASGTVGEFVTLQCRILQNRVSLSAPAGIFLLKQFCLEHLLVYVGVHI